MRISTVGTCEELDATFFSSDEFYNRGSLEEIKYYVGRWQRKIIEIEETLTEMEPDI